MNPTQIYSIVNNLAQQSLGSSAVVNSDATFIAVGKQVLSSENNVDAFYKTLVDRIGRTVMALREYNFDMEQLAREPFVYGAILQKLSFKMPQAQENNTWDALTDTYADPFEKMDTEIMQVFFDKWSTWEVGGTIPDVQLETAFTDAVTMAAFIDGLFLNMRNAQQVAYENLGVFCRAALMGQTYSIATATGATTGTNCVVHLVTEYNNESGQSLTTQSAKTNTDFLKYASMRMRLISNQMMKFSTVFNPYGWQRHTPYDRQVFEVLANFASMFDTYLQADTYHQQMTELKYYKPIQYWQGSGTSWSWKDVSSINVTLTSVNAGVETDVDVSMTNVVAVLRDIDSAGITIDKQRTKSMYNPRGEYTNYWLKSEMGYFIDKSENCVVFMLD